jgi:hypothetical protein
MCKVCPTICPQRYLLLLELTPDHISFFPDTDEDGFLQAEEERAQCFIVFGKGSRQRLLFFDTVTAIDLGSAPNPVGGQ